MPTQIQVLSNLNFPIGDILQQEIQNAKQVQIAVAFLKQSGIQVIDKAIKQCLNSGGSFEVITGLDFKTTDAQSLRYFVELKKAYPKAKFYCFGDKKQNKTDIMFHPKMYLFEKAKGTTGIVGSTNLTQGGLTSNLEVNTIFKETKPVYFGQLRSIYDAIKFTDSVFAPDAAYVSEYAGIYKTFAKNETKASKDKGLQKVIKLIHEKEKTLPGTIPSIKSLMIQIIKEQQRAEGDFIELRSIYSGVEKLIAEQQLPHKVDTVRNTIRGDFNKHEESSTHPDNMHLFVRSPDRKGFYTLTKKGRDYHGR